VEVNARDYLDDDDRRGHPVDDKAEGRPPAGLRNELAAVLPQILEAVGSEAYDEQPRDPVTAAAATTTKTPATVLSKAMTGGRPSATAKPM
jgi:hypothetical protein